MKSKGTIMIVAGGTGGHVFSAEALGIELISRGFDVHFLTDNRARRFVHFLVTDRIHLVNSSTFTGKKILGILSAFLSILLGIYQSYRIFQRHRPCLVVGFGGYPTIPPLYTAVCLKIPTLIHEQNAVMGRANQFLASRVNLIAGGLLKRKSKGVFFHKIVITGNPLRSSILEVVGNTYKVSEKEEDFFLLIIGGSQGASFFSEIIPKAIKCLDKDWVRRLVIIQQARENEVENLRYIYKQLNVRADIQGFFHNIAEYMVKSHYIIARAGALTISEIAAIGRPALLIPYPYALDHDQMQNAKILALSGGIEIVHQSELTPDRLVIILNYVLNNANMLKVMAKKVQSVGIPHATQKLADVAITIIKKFGS